MARSGAISFSRDATIFIGQAVEAIAPYAGLRELARQRELLRQGRLALMEGGVEAGDLRDMRRGLGDRFDGGQIVRLMQRGERNQRASVGHHAGIDPDRRGEFGPAMDHPMPDRGHLLCPRADR